jgi:hypothetical protein
MIGLLLYCGAVFTILILYYFYKPIDEAISLAQAQAARLSEFGDETAALSGSAEQDCIDQTRTNSLAGERSPLKNKSVSFAATERRSLERCNSNASTLTSLSASDLNSWSIAAAAVSVNENENNANNKSSILTVIINALIRYFRVYFLAYVFPLLKYLGLNYSNDSIYLYKKDEQQEKDALSAYKKIDDAYK